MLWKKLKFQLLRIGKNNKIKEDTVLFTHEYTIVIDRITTVKDLGIQVDDNMRYTRHITKAVTKTRQKAG